MKFLPKFSQSNNVKFLYLASGFSQPNHGFEDNGVGVGRYETIISAEANKTDAELGNLQREIELKKMSNLDIISKIRSDQEWAFKTFTKDLGNGRYEVYFYGDEFLEDQLSLYDLLPQITNFVQVERRLWGGVLGGTIGKRSELKADEKRLGGIGFQNIENLNGERDDLKIEDGTVFRIIGKEESVQISEKYNISESEFPTSGNEVFFEQKRTQDLMIRASIPSNDPEWNRRLNGIRPKWQNKLNGIAQEIHNNLSTAHPNEYRKILVEQFFLMNTKLRAMSYKSKPLSKESHSINRLIEIFEKKQEKFFETQKDFVNKNYDKLREQLPNVLSLDQAKKLIGYLRINQENLNPKMVLFLVNKMGIAPNKKQKVEDIVLDWIKNKDHLDFGAEVQVKNEIFNSVTDIYSDSRFQSFLQRYASELTKAGIKTSITGILEAGNIDKMQVFLKSKKLKFSPETYPKLNDFLVQLKGLEIKNFKLNSQISRSDLRFRNLQKVVNDLQSNPQEFFKKITEDLGKKEKNQLPIRNYFGSVAMTAEEKAQSDEMLADLPADVAVSESLGEGRFEVQVGNADAHLILDFKRKVMSPAKLPKSRKKYVELPLDARYLVGLQTVAAMQDFMFSGKDKFAKKMEDLAGPESLAKLFFVLFYPRNDVLTEQEENRLLTFGRDLQRKGKTFFDYLEEFKNPPIIDNGRIWLQGVPIHKKAILEGIGL
jgi:hypothetical protein